jgi:glycosyltransferase involved in cell wall biosynthesis
MLLRNGAVCEDCVGRVPWRAVAHACYRGSRSQSAVAAVASTVHRSIGAGRRVDRYIALNAFCRTKFIEAGLPAGAISIKPNFVADVPPRARDSHARSAGLFVGRLSPEKGLSLLIEARRRAGGGQIVVGSGALTEVARSAFGEAYLGALPLAGVLEQMSAAAYLVVPSLWYEAFPRTIVEAFSCGLPVIASRLGALRELVSEGRTGLLFDPGDVADLASKLAWADANPEAMQRMGVEARSVYESEYTPERNYELLERVYDEALEQRRRSLRRSAP